jgi:ABC-type Zn uptake system ZnuABC Zn-binding protein ZnuA
MIRSIKWYFVSIKQRREFDMIPKRLWFLTLSLVLALSLALVGCGQETAEPIAESITETNHQNDDHHDDDHHDDDHDDDHQDDDHDHDDDHHDDDDNRLVLPALAPVDLHGEKLRVVATTSIIGDIVGRIGGDAIELVTLMGPGVDPHSYQPSAAELTAVADAHLIFINGWDLEEGLIRDLENVAEGVPIVPVSAYIEPLAFEDDHVEDDSHEDSHDDSHGDSHDHDHDHDADPHVWFNPHLVKQWVENIEHTLHDLDPANEALYEDNAEAYLAELEALIEYVEARIAEIPAERRKLVTNHDTFGYFARAYGFEIVGTVIPSASTLSEPSARELAQLVERMQTEGVCTIFTESVANERLAQTVAAELSGCAEVQVLRLFTDALGGPGSGAETYLDMMRVNIDTIVTGLTS